MIANRLASFNVLVVDDSSLIRNLVHSVLLKLGFENVFELSNAKKALEFMETKSVDFIISDWRMPELNGIDLVRHVRQTGTTINPHIPIIMLTGNGEAHHVTEARDAGVTEFLVKPFSVKELCTRIEEVIERPREFILALSYKGPSRRRKTRLLANGEIDRRKNRGQRRRRI